MRIDLAMMAACVAGCVALAGCESKSETPAKGGAPAASGGHAHDHDHDHAHNHDHGDGHGHDGRAIELGEGTAGPFKLRAARDEGEVKAGGDAAVDVWVDAAAADAPKVVAVRIWIGTEDAAGSIKARAEIEGEPNHWHAHAEAPEPMPAGSRLWVEIEDDRGGRHTASFELKA